MARHKVDICGVNTANMKVLTNEENKELFQKLKEGDSFAREDLINGNLKLVLSILRKFNGKTDNLDDLFQVGCLGLVKAIDHFDSSYDVKLSTYAVPMILGEIKRYLRDNSSLRVSRSIKDLAYKTLKLKEELVTSNGIEPTDKEIASILGVTEFEISNALESLREPMSMYEPIYNDGGDTIYLFDQIGNKKEEYDLDYKLAVDKAMSNLKARDRQILEERFIIGKTQMEIASELGISQAQISRIEKNAIKVLKKNIKE
ncbi:MAG: SigB/SigF/SigG family RNA polymerase sigma factor [Bacilli bacterium]|nr:SigB/SigF/SigG family RNA polymerase sigma factor [Bacilli bacterium]